MIDMKKRHCNVALFVPHAGCPHQCSFCNQRHIANTVNAIAPNEVVSACERALQTMDVVSSDAEIAFFGGSFTAIERETMVALLEAAAPFVRDGRFGGIRVSTRPDAIDEEILSILCNYGVTTVELGAQSMDDFVLRKNRRGHTAQQVEQAAYLIKKAGLRLGLQMMTGLPGDTPEGALRTARLLAALQPDCVRIYPTLIIEHTSLADWYRRGEYRPQSLDEAIELCAQLLAFFEDENHIPVIRLGLHNEEEMTKHCLAGPIHPAFRERCESRLLFSKIRLKLAQEDGGKVEISVSPARLSQAIGHKKENVYALQALGYEVQVKADASLQDKDIRVEVIR